MGECLDAISSLRVFLPSNIGHKTTTDNKNRLLVKHQPELQHTDKTSGQGANFAIYSELIHRIHNAQESGNCLGFFANLGLVDLEL